MTAWVSCHHHHLVWLAVVLQHTVIYACNIVNALVQSMTSAVSSEVPAVSGRTVHRGPAVRPGAGEPEQVCVYIQLFNSFTWLVAQVAFPFSMFLTCTRPDLFSPWCLGHTLLCLVLLLLLIHFSYQNRLLQSHV